MKFTRIEGIQSYSENNDELTNQDTSSNVSDNDWNKRHRSFTKEHNNILAQEINDDIQKNIIQDTEKDSLEITMQSGLMPKKKIIGSGQISTNPTRICVMGVGGGGVNAINMMVEEQIRGVDIVAANTDAQTLNSSMAPSAMPLGHNLGGGLGVGGDPIKGAEAARSIRKDICEWVKNYDMLFLATGMGGGTGTGATPVIAEFAKEAGVLTLAVVTLPFAHEGNQRIDVAEYGLEELRSVVDSLIVIPNENILQYDFSSHDTRVLDGFKVVDSVLSNVVKSITDIITIPGRINIDFADIKSCLMGAGRIAVGFGTANSEDHKSGNAHRAVEEALKNTVISQENMDVLKHANCIIANTVTGPEISMNDYHEMSDLIKSRSEDVDNSSFKHGYRVVDDWGRRVQVTLIASHRGDSFKTKKFGKDVEKLYPEDNYMSLQRNEHARNEHARKKEIVSINSDYVTHDMFDKILGKNESLNNEELLPNEEINLDKYNTPSVKRLLGLSESSAGMTSQNNKTVDREMVTETNSPHRPLRSY